VNRVVLSGTTIAARNATLELYNGDNDWNLVVSLEGSTPWLRLSGTTTAPALPGPSQLWLFDIDEPREVRSVE
jgi:hypothetical protein